MPGLGLATVLTAVMARYAFIYGWSWMESMLFGAIISATDPVAVVSLLSTLGMKKQCILANPADFSSCSMNFLE